eukprot:11198267-Lingulodinium_polyedra.AAC.1
MGLGVGAARHDSDRVGGPGAGSCPHARPIAGARQPSSGRSGTARGGPDPGGGLVVGQGVRPRSEGRRRGVGGYRAGR